MCCSVKIYFSFTSLPVLVICLQSCQWHTMYINNLSTNVLFVSVSDGFAVIVSLIPLRGLVDFSLILDWLIRPHHCHETWPECCSSCCFKKPQNLIERRVTNNSSLCPWAPLFCFFSLLKIQPSKNVILPEFSTCDYAWHHTYYSNLCHLHGMRWD